MYMHNHGFLRFKNVLIHGTFHGTYVLILDGNSEIGAHVRSNLCHLIWIRHLISSGVVLKGYFFYPKILFFFHAYATCYELPFYIGSVVFT